MITFRFLLWNIDMVISCMDIAEELQFFNIIVLEVCLFLRKIDDSVVLIPIVLLTKVGTTLLASAEL